MEENKFPPTLVTDKFLNVLAFCIVMGNAQLLGKSPDYITEKLERYMGWNDKGPITAKPMWRWGLDAANTGIFNEYLRRWNLEAPKEDMD